MAKDCHYLMKLKLSHININNCKLIGSLAILVENSEVLSTLDLSWCNLSASNLSKICVSLIENSSIMRNLNLSYNSLLNDKMGSEFVKNLIQFVQQSESICHLDLSGMLFKKEEIVEICKVVSAHPEMMGVHLTDNGLGND